VGVNKGRESLLEASYFSFITDGLGLVDFQKKYIHWLPL